MDASTFRRRRTSESTRDDIDGDVTISFAKLPSVDISTATANVAAAADDDAFFLKPAIPYWEIAFAGLLFVVGSVCLAIAALIALGRMHSSMDDRMWSVLVLGLLMDIPGVYYIGMALCVLLKVPGWSWSRLPQMN